MDVNQQIKSVLIELKQASLAIQGNASYETWHNLMEQYDMLFLGEKFNTISCIELQHTLKNKFYVNIELEELLSLIPQICSALGMKIDPLVRLTDVGNPTAPIADCSIELF